MVVWWTGGVMYGQRGLQMIYDKIDKYCAFSVD